MLVKTASREAYSLHRSFGKASQGAHTDAKNAVRTYNHMRGYIVKYRHTAENTGIWEIFSEIYCKILSAVV